MAASLLIAGTAFIALGFMSTAAETALVGVADGHDPGAVDALNELQGRIPVVWTVTALVMAISLAALRTGLLPRWLGIGGLVLAAIFLLAGASSLIGRTVEGGYSLIGVALFIVWMLALAACLWRAAPANA
jgi:prepilin signal peptidase PulO-like enzyme (type II secretory pathway)